ncbi:MAG TPA: alpha-amylase family glycosyl hydrolase [Candidatus Limnocylindrales bacterium]|nr:alpha-amylase family glycosyl hydrolase [Candidatus Limnocylindrales bacterium]
MSRPRAGLGPEWWREGVFYQVYPRSFGDSNGDGVGDLRGITAHLDHLNGRPDSLGIDAIWISPFYPSPMADFGYDVADYCDVDPQFGTLADFGELLEGAHARGIRVIVDLVPNHSSDRHPWFVESRSSRTNPKRDWYVWADPGPGRGPPNAWRSVFQRVQGSAWTLDPTTGQYYLHSFLPQQPDLNWRNPEVRAAFERIMRFWLDRGVDGFRIDVAHKTVKPAELVGVPIPENPRGRPDLTPPADEPELHALLRTWRKLLDEYGDRMAVGECVVLDPDRFVKFYGEQADELHLAFNFMFLRAPWSAEAFRERVETFEELLPAEAWPDYTLSNHDNSRAVSRYAPRGDLEAGRQRARLAAMMLLTLRGTPFVYYGEEIGMADGPVPRDRIVDVAGRDPARTPMQWNGTPGGGFSAGEGEPWLPVNPETAVVNVEAQRRDPESMFELYRRLIAERRSSPALRRGSYRTVASPKSVFAYLREVDGEGDGERRLVALNFAARPARVSVPGRAGLLRLSTDPGRAAGPVRDVVELGPDEGILVEL